MSFIDWQWRAFKAGSEREAEQPQKTAHDGGFHAITSMACSHCKQARYSVWIFTGAGSDSPAQAKKMLAAETELGTLLRKQCPHHPPFIKSFLLQTTEN